MSLAWCGAREAFREWDYGKSSLMHRSHCPLPSANARFAEAPSSAEALAACPSHPASLGPPLPSPVAVRLTQSCGRF